MRCNLFAAENSYDSVASYVISSYIAGKKWYIFKLFHCFSAPSTQLLSVQLQTFENVRLVHNSQSHFVRGASWPVNKAVIYDLPLIKY